MSEVSDARFLLAVKAATFLRALAQEGDSEPWRAYSLDIAAVLSGHPEDIGATGSYSSYEVTWKEVTEKAKGLITKGWLLGCTCGCRGEFLVTPLAEAELGWDAV